MAKKQKKYSKTLDISPQLDYNNSRNKENRLNIEK